MQRLIALLLASISVGCANPVPYYFSTVTAPDVVWVKPGASHAEQMREAHDCNVLRYEARRGAKEIIFHDCMTAGGWTRYPALEVDGDG